MISRRTSFRIRSNQAPKTDRLNQIPSWGFRNRLKSFTPRQLAKILWDFAYLCWANTIDSLIEALRDRRRAKLECGQKRWRVASQLRISISNEIEVIEIFSARQ